jgi:hypothetical protein
VPLRAAPAVGAGLPGVVGSGGPGRPPPLVGSPCQAIDIKSGADMLCCSICCIATRAGAELLGAVIFENRLECSSNER